MEKVKEESSTQNKNAEKIQDKINTNKKEFDFFVTKSVTDGVKLLTEDKTMESEKGVLASNQTVTFFLPD